jgi:16S rRNA (cytosine967-C5)-methyltransferase
LAALRAYLKFAQGGSLRPPPPDGAAEGGGAALYTNLLRGMVRHRRWLEAETERLTRRPLAKLDGPVSAGVMLGLLQLYTLRLPAHAAVFETVQAVSALGFGFAKGLVNAALRAAQRELAAGRDPAADYPLAVRTSHPDWLVERWTRRYGAETARSVCEANNRFDGFAARVETRRISRDALLARLAQEGVAATPHPLLQDAIRLPNVAGLLRGAAFAEGLCYVQDVASQVLVQWVAPRLAGRVLDACAAPGGKLTHLLAMERPGLRVAGSDSTPARLGRVAANLTRLRLPSVALLAADGRALPFGDGVFGAVLLDVPCSATGMIRKYPELAWRKHADDLPRFAATQAGLLDEAARVTALGGLVVYSTCSLEPEENEEQAAAFLARHPGFQALSFADLPPPPGLAAPAAELLTDAGHLLVLPAPDRMGLFAALLERRG